LIAKERFVADVKLDDVRIPAHPMSRLPADFDTQLATVASSIDAKDATPLRKVLDEIKAGAVDELDLVEAANMLSRLYTSRHGALATDTEHLPASVKAAAATLTSQIDAMCVDPGFWGGVRTFFHWLGTGGKSLPSDNNTWNPLLL
jgi:hypothetical protein